MSPTPYTPFHWGFTILIYALFFFLDPIGLFLGNAFPDIEGFLARYLKMGNPVHGVMHTLIGGVIEVLIVSILSSLLWYLVREKLDPRWITFLNRFNLPPNPSVTVISTTIGVFSHFLIDMFVHPELYLLWPVIESNPLFDLVPISLIYLLSFISAIVGIIIINLRIISVNSNFKVLDSHHS